MYVLYRIKWNMRFRNKLFSQGNGKYGFLARASENPPCFFLLHHETGVFKLRALLGERTLKNHSAVKKVIPES